MQPQICNLSLFYSQKSDFLIIFYGYNNQLNPLNPPDTWLSSAGAVYVTKASLYLFLYCLYECTVEAGLCFCLRKMLFEGQIKDGSYSHWCRRPPQSADDACLYCGGWMERRNTSVTSHQEPASVAHHDSAATNQRQDPR